eukprot:11209421-Lingulodinium_polyedra.AAC.1
MAASFSMTLFAWSSTCGATIRASPAPGPRQAGERGQLLWRQLLASRPSVGLADAVVVDPLD